MLVVAEKSPIENAFYIKNNTNKNFLFKSLLELAQLICSCGISNVFKRVHRAKEIQNWILKNKLWVYRYYNALYFMCLKEINAKPITFVKLYKIREDLYELVKNKRRITYPKTAIFRYKKGYSTKYKTNSELPIEECMKAYREYIETYKFPRKGELNEGVIKKEH
jgi:hypothetical protein